MFQIRGDLLMLRVTFDPSGGVGEFLVRRERAFGDVRGANDSRVPIADLEVIKFRVEIRFSVVNDDVLGTERGKFVGGLLLRMHVVGIENHARSARDGLLQFFSNCLDAVVFQMAGAYRDELGVCEILLDSRKMPILAALCSIPNEC
jgi:hypothetical protein